MWLLRGEFGCGCYGVNLDVVAKGRCGCYGWKNTRR